jgi:hypothetical protein
MEGLVLTEHLSDYFGTLEYVVEEGDSKRTEHLQGLPYGLFVQDPVMEIWVVTVFYALHVLVCNEVE